MYACNATSPMEHAPLLVAHREQHADRQPQRWRVGVAGATVVTMMLAAAAFVRANNTGDHSTTLAASPPAAPAEPDAAPENKLSSSVSCVDTGLPVLSGVDVVAYFSLEKDAQAVYGNSTFQSVYKNYTFYFSSHENLALFEADPEKYTPQYGGFCTYAVVYESFWNWRKFHKNGPGTNVNTWTILDGKLYLFMYALPEEYFLSNQSDIGSVIERGNERWDNWTRGETYFDTNCFWYNIDCGHTASSCVTPSTLTAEY